MHDDIIRYSLDGKISDTNVVQEKERLIHFMENQMRYDGVVPSLDLDPQFTWEYNSHSESYDFTLTVYGTHVGTEKAWKTAGTMAGTTIDRYSRKENDDFGMGLSGVGGTDAEPD